MKSPEAPAFTHAAADDALLPGSRQIGQQKVAEYCEKLQPVVIETGATFFEATTAMAFQYFAEDPTLARLLAPTYAADLPQHAALLPLAAQPVGADEQARARAWAAALGIRMVMVHRDRIPPQTLPSL